MYFVPMLHCFCLDFILKSEDVKVSGKKFTFSEILFQRSQQVIDLIIFLQYENKDMLQKTYHAHGYKSSHV